MAIAILKQHQPFLTRNAFFDVPNMTLTPQHRRTVTYCSRLHGMPWQPRSSERIVHPQQQVEAVMRQWFELVQQTSRKQRPVVAYKGGHVELDLLTVMNIPTCNLELWNCPKVDALALQFPEVKPEVHMCYKGNHALAGDTALVHCPKLEVTLFAEFVAAEWSQQRREKRRRRNAERRLKRRAIENSETVNKHIKL